MITMKDVADQAGVSLMTVSNVIHRKTKRVSKETTDRVMKVVNQLGYVPNMEARNLAHSRSRLICVALLHALREPDLHLEDPFISELLDVLESEIQRLGLYLLLHIAPDVASILNVAKTWNVEGTIILFTNPTEIEQILSSIDKPTVFIDCQGEESIKNYVNVGLDDYGGGIIATEYLIKLGHREIFYVHNDSTLVGVSNKRCEGYRHALSEAGIEVLEKNIVPLRVNPDQSINPFQSLFERRREVTAMLFDADSNAVDAINYFQDRNIMIPKDLSVIGFDDARIARIVRPQLTTVRQDIRLKGTIAMQQLMKLVEFGAVDKQIISNPVELIIRDSVRKIN